MVAPATGLVTCAAIAVRPGAFCAAAGDTASNDAPIIRAAENFIQSTPQVFAGCAWELVGMADISRPSNQVSRATRRASSARHITCGHDSIATLIADERHVDIDTRPARRPRTGENYIINTHPYTLAH